MIYRITKALLIIMLLGVFACNNSTDKNYKGAVGASEAWLALVDEGKYSDSWKAAASNLKLIVNEEQWEDALLDYRKLLGKVHSRSLQTKGSTTLKSGLSEERLMSQYKTNG